MGQFKAVGMQQVAQIAGQGLSAGQGNATWPIEGVTHQRMSRPGQMNADLVGAACADLHCHKGGLLLTLQHGHTAL